MSEAVYIDQSQDKENVAFHGSRAHKDPSALPGRPEACNGRLDWSSAPQLPPAAAAPRVPSPESSPYRQMTQKSFPRHTATPRSGYRSLSRDGPEYDPFVVPNNPVRACTRTFKLFCDMNDPTSTGRPERNSENSESGPDTETYSEVSSGTEGNSSFESYYNYAARVSDDDVREEELLLSFLNDKSADSSADFDDGSTLEGSSQPGVETEEETEGEAGTETHRKPNLHHNRPSARHSRHSRHTQDAAHKYVPSMLSVTSQTNMKVHTEEVLAVQDSMFRGTEIPLGSVPTLTAPSEGSAAVGSVPSENGLSPYSLTAAVAELPSPTFRPRNSSHGTARSFQPQNGRFRGGSRNTLDTKLPGMKTGGFLLSKTNAVTPKASRAEIFAAKIASAVDLQDAPAEEEEFLYHTRAEDDSGPRRMFRRPSDMSILSQLSTGSGSIYSQPQWKSRRSQMRTPLAQKRLPGGFQTAQGPKEHYRDGIDETERFIPQHTHFEATGKDGRYGKDGKDGKYGKQRAESREFGYLDGGRSRCDNYDEEKHIGFITFQKESSLVNPKSRQSRKKLGKRQVDEKTSLLTGKEFRGNRTTYLEEEIPFAGRISKKRSVSRQIRRVLSELSPHNFTTRRQRARLERGRSFMRLIRVKHAAAATGLLLIAALKYYKLAPFQDS